MDVRWSHFRRRVASIPRLSLILLLGIFWPAVVKSAQSEVVDLPPLMVEESAVPLRWRYASLSDAEFLSACSDSVTREFLRRYHTQSALLQWILPARFQGRSSVRDEYILISEEAQRARSQEVVETMLRNDAARAQKEAARTPPKGERSEPARFRFLPNMRLSDLDTTAVFVIIRETQPDSVSFNFSAERIAHLLQAKVPDLPPWFGAGMIVLYQQTAFEQDRIIFRPALWGSADELKALQTAEDAPRTLLSMEEMFLGRPGRVSPERAEFDEIWRSQCALFLRWVIAENQGNRREKLWAFLDALEKQPLSESLFESHFGFNYADMRDVLSDYVGTAVNQQLTLRGPKLPKLPDIQLRAATPVEVSRIRGDWERIQIDFVRKSFPSAVPKYVDQARRTLRKAYDAGERDPHLQAVLGLLECDLQDYEAAAPFLEVAVKAGITRPRVYYELGLQRYYVAIKGSPDGFLSESQRESILAPLLKGRSQPPLIAGNFALLADVWLRSKAPIPGAELQQINRASELFPYHPSVVVRAAELNLKYGHVDLADRQLQRLLPLVTNESTRDVIRHRLQQVASARHRASQRPIEPTRNN